MNDSALQAQQVREMTILEETQASNARREQDQRDWQERQREADRKWQADQQELALKFQNELRDDERGFHKEENALFRVVQYRSAWVQGGATILAVLLAAFMGWMMQPKTVVQPEVQSIPVAQP